MSLLSVPLRRLPHGNGLPLPAYASEHAAGADLLAAIDEPVIIPPLARVLVPTGVAIALPGGYEAQVRPRSGLAVRHGVTVINSPGTIDSDYRGEILVALVNLGSETFRIERGMRIAQLIVSAIRTVSWRETAELPESERGAGGFGSTGLATGDAASAAGDR